MGKLVSVIIPTYNYARFVHRAIDSVLAQTYPDLECVVVDDGSTDETPQVLARYGSRIRVIRKEKQGPGIARNTGIRAARGEYVAFLDSDDYWRANKLSRQVPVIEAEPSLGAVGCANELVDGNGVHVANVVFPSPSTPVDLAAQLRAVAVRKLWVGSSCSGALIPKRVLEEVGLFDETLAAAEDWDLWLKIAARYPIRNIPEVLVSISTHGTGFARDADKVERNQWKVYEAALSRWPEVFGARIRRQVRALILADAGGEHVGGKAYGTALRMYWKSLLAWPMHTGRWYVTARLLLRQVGI
jgi:glycosyltransferase involved in cell wall biosynthesis